MNYDYALFVVAIVTLAFARNDPLTTLVVILALTISLAMVLGRDKEAVLLIKILADVAKKFRR